MDDNTIDSRDDALLAPLIEQIGGHPDAQTVDIGCLRAAIYARRSITDPDDDSIGIQLQKATEHCDAIGASCDLKCHVFIDRHRSGRTMAGREGLRKLLALVAAGSIDVIVAKGVDRVTRSHRDAVLLDEFFKNHRIALHIAGQGPIDDMALIVGGYQAQVDHAMIRERLEGGRREADRAGLLIASHERYGYERIDEWPFLKINEEQAAVIQRAFAEMDAGALPMTVMRGLNRDGVAPPQGKLWANPFQKFSILRNPLLKGLYRPAKTDGSDDISVPSLEIIDPDLFDRVVAKYKPVARENKGTKPAPFVTPEIRCRCGGLMNPLRKRASDVAVCRTRNFSGGCDASWEIHTSEIARRVLLFVIDELLAPDCLAEWDRIRNDGWEARWDATKVEREAITDEIQAIDRRMEQDPDLGFEANSLSAIAQRHKLEMRQIQLIQALEPLKLSIQDITPSPETDDELRGAIIEMLRQLPDLRFGTINPAIIERLRQLVPAVIVDLDGAGRSYDLHLLVGIPGLSELPLQQRLSADPRWVKRSFPRPAKSPLAYPEVVLAHHARSERGDFRLSAIDWTVVKHLFLPEMLPEEDAAQIAEGMYFLEVTRMRPEMLPERYHAVAAAITRIHSTPLRARFFKILRTKGSKEIRDILGRARRGSISNYATPII
ncbi:recombinase family protein [Methylobacterium sp. NPDC080182]|uniref:recombinase family protein n=1 Tax=Methylobacterium sp. NPDC080182 TaxID=3390590 RepID=UPI003D06565E